MNHLVSELREKREKIIIPTPVLCETLIHADKAAPEWFLRLSRSSAFRIEPFDARAAVELAYAYSGAIKSGDKRAGSTETMAKIKFDRQIVSIAKANKVQIIYSSDGNLKKFAEARGITVIPVWDLPLPPPGSQRGLWDTPDAPAPT